VRGASSYEQLQERVINFAGRVWQLKDGIIKWLLNKPNLTLGFDDFQTSTILVGTGGPYAENLIEDAAELSMPLLLCADLYNSYKHYADCNRSNYQPYLDGVEFGGSNIRSWGIYYDVTRKASDITVADPSPVPIRIELRSRNHEVDFGDAVVNIGRAFRHWIPLFRQVELLLTQNPPDQAIRNDLTRVEKAVDDSTPFKQNQQALNIDALPLELRLLARRDPASFARHVRANQTA
jgi:hypothetical protein